MSQLYAGFARVNATPMFGINMRGYFYSRYVDGVLDDLEITALALDDGAARVMLISFDCCAGDAALMTRYRKAISEKTGLPTDAIFIHCTHTHTGAELSAGDPNSPNEKTRLLAEYSQFIERRMVDVSTFALADLKPAKMGTALGKAPGIAFIRRFRMKDGSVATNPGVNNPNIVAPIGEVDERVNVVRFDREGGSTIILANFGCHPDTVNGTKISADWPGVARRTLERALDNVNVIFFNGAQGDVNHVDVHPKTTVVSSHRQHMGNVVAGAVLEVFEKVAWTDESRIRFAEKTVVIPSNMPTPDQLPLAHHICELHAAGRDSEIPTKGFGMARTTAIAEALRMVRLENGPEHFDMSIIGVAIGNVALCGIPGEPFNGIGLGIKEAQGWELVLPCCLTNGGQGYFPMQEAYDEGGYEARSSPFKAGVAEKIIETGVAVLDGLR